MKTAGWNLLALLVFSMCSEDLPDCPGKMCIIAGGWRLAEAYVDGEPDNGDLSQYRLILHAPVPETNTSSDFERTQPSGNKDDGSWSIENGGTILKLTPGAGEQFTEDWVIDDVTPRKLVLIMNRDTGIKQGPSVIRFVLIPI